MHLLFDLFDRYAEDHSQPEPQVLQELSRETHLKVLHPRMLSGHFQGRFLSFISKIVSPKHILEIGTFTGYSAISLAEGLVKNGTLDTIDINEELSDLQRKYFDKSGFGEQIIQHIGNALEIIPTINKTFDLVFIDADKPSYPAYFDMVVEKMRPGGLILSDNVLWSGKVIDETAKDKKTEQIRAYNKKINEDIRVETLLLPLRDGLTISRVL
ncbi:O-methyltransferase [Zhouia sp. PK063]|uniref:O-methyltransferase n=1 Tax=Zhouia sp. PK063 TaxID=3373602 RepID=UPI00379FB7C0